MAVNKTKLTTGGEVGEIKTQPTVINKLSSNFLRLSFGNKVLIIIIPVLIVVALVYGYGETSQPVTNNTCRDVIKTAQWVQISKALQSSNADEFQNSITLLQGSCVNYENDNDYSYVMTVHGINTSNYNKAREYFNKLPNTENRVAFGLSKVTTLQSNTSLNAQIVALESSKDTMINSTTIVPLEEQ
jgi:hypothetical protein